MTGVKLAVKRFSSGRTFIGDVVGVYDSDDYLGKEVEEKGGAYSLIIITDADVDDPDVKNLADDWYIVNPDWSEGDEENPQFINHPAHKRRYYLEPVTSGEIFDTLLATGRYNATKSELLTYIRDRANA